MLYLSYKLFVLVVASFAPTLFAPVMAVKGLTFIGKQAVHQQGVSLICGPTSHAGVCWHESTSCSGLHTEPIFGFTHTDVQISQCQSFASPHNGSTCLSLRSRTSSLTGLSAPQLVWKCERYDCRQPGCAFVDYDPYKCLVRRSHSLASSS